MDPRAADARPGVLRDDQALAGRYAALRGLVSRKHAAEFLEPMTPEDLRLALADGDRWPRAAFALLYQVPEHLDAEMLQALKQLDRKILDSIAPDVYRLKVGIAAVLARSGDEASMQISARSVGSGSGAPAGNRHGTGSAAQRTRTGTT
jgi:hypothetical protein